MGKIASIGNDQALALFRKVILASASVPALFPPVFFKVEARGKTYDEMHVDGGTITQVFTLYKVLSNAQGIAKELNVDPSKIKSKCYIIRNGYVSSTYKPVRTITQAG